MNMIKIVTYILSIWISSKYPSEYWVIGPVFGLTVVLWDSTHISKVFSFRHALFVAASALIYALVLRIIISEHWKFPYEVLDVFFGTFSAGVIVGSLLLPFAHSLILENHKGQNWQVSIALILSFYLTNLIWFLNEKLKLSLPFYDGGVVIAAWQTVYLVGFFRKK